MLKSHLDPTTPRPKISKIEILANQLVFTIKKNYHLEMLFKSFTSFSCFQKSIYNADYLTTATILIKFITDVINNDEKEDPLFKGIKEENDRLDLLKNELASCVSSSKEVLLTQNKSFHSRGFSFNSTMFVDDSMKDMSSNGKKSSSHINY